MPSGRGSPARWHLFVLGSQDLRAGAGLDCPAMRRTLLVLVPCLASCGLLMDFEPGGEGGSTPGSTSGSSSATESATLSAIAANGPGGGDGAAGGEGPGAGGPGGSGSAGGDPGAGGAGGLDWSAVIGGPGAEHLRALAVSDLGAIAIAGDYDQSLDAGTAGFVVGPGEVGTFVALFDRDGTQRWAKPISVYQPSAVPPEYDDIDVGFVGEDVVVTGSFAETVAVDPDSGVYVNQGAPSVYAATLAAPDGHLVWGFRTDDEEDAEEPRAALGGKSAIRDDGTIILVGWYCGTFAFGSNCEQNGPACNGDDQFDIFIATINPQGLCTSSTSFGSPSTRDRATEVALDPMGRIALAGETDGHLDLGNEIFLSTVERTAFVAMLDASYAPLVIESLDQAAEGVSVVFDQGEELAVRFAGPLAAGPLGSTGFGETDFVAGRVLVTGQREVSAVFGGDFPDTGFLRRTRGGAWRAYGTFSGRDANFGTALVTATATDAFSAPIAAQASRPLEVFGGSGDQVVVAAADDPGDGHEILGGHFDGATLVDGSTVSPDSDDLDIFVVARRPETSP